MTIWVNEQLDPSGLMYACIACCNEAVAKECHQSFENNLTSVQKEQGWIARLRVVESWDEVPVNSLKLSF
ncbi:glycogen debranching protein [Lusitaniella coriacea LEGE 07157]|uniref:Glycogen debranching protein n=1 Tax=Lusitaniella coriacea LEGE 07157 TaxID=945747 RepID=A0A8J7DW43_9CYAN|nr:glycogen debranching protein [Lusitaniella coriacea]MBE9116206.1 glycogen debranching protein [Lusitaniella coriacea LEGE 07157]